MQGDTADHCREASLTQADRPAADVRACRSRARSAEVRDLVPAVASRPARLGLHPRRLSLRARSARRISVVP